MDVGRQLQGFVGRQPRTPQAETLVTEPSAFLCCPSRQPATRFRTIQPCGQILQRQDGLPALRPPCGLVRRGPLAVLYDLVQGDGLRLNLMPYPAQRRQGHRRGVQSPADAPLPAFDPTPEHLFLGKAEQGKTAYLTKILGDEMICLRVSRVAGHRRRRVILHGGLCRVGIFPGGIVRDQRPDDDVGVRYHWLSRLVGIEPAGA